MSRYDGYDGGDMVLVVISTLLASFVFHLILLDASHRYLGSLGAPCFANNTCRDKLACVHYEGLKPTCVEK